MLISEAPVESLSPPGVDLLFDWQWRVAVRADELARGHPFSRGRDLLLWRRAEREVFGFEVAAAPHAFR